VDVLGVAARPRASGVVAPAVRAASASESRHPGIPVEQDARPTQENGMIPITIIVDAEGKFPQGKQ
jgi:hypothetical protein